MSSSHIQRNTSSTLDDPNPSPMGRFRLNVLVQFWIVQRCKHAGLLVGTWFVLIVVLFQPTDLTWCSWSFQWFRFFCPARSALFISSEVIQIAPNRRIAGGHSAMGILNRPLIFIIIVLIITISLPLWFQLPCSDYAAFGSWQKEYRSRMNVSFYGSLITMGSMSQAWSMFYQI